MGFSVYFIVIYLRCITKQRILEIYTPEWSIGEIAIIELDIGFFELLLNIMIGRYL